MQDSLEDKVVSYRMMAKQIKELEERKKLLGVEILSMLEKDIKTFYISDFRIWRWKRLSIKTSLDDARALGATKQEEVIDKEMLKKLFDLGNPVPDVTVLESIIVCDNLRSKVDRENL